jgi:hypothetical protein
LLSGATTHKSDAGLVLLNLGDADELRAALVTLIGHAPAGEVAEILIQQMAAPGVEALIGVDVDAQFGPVIACGVGGLLVELFNEVALRLPPLTLADAEAMVDETVLGALLTGLRGRPAGDRVALADLLVRIADFAAAHTDQLASLDLNPVIVHEEGISLVDVRVAWRDRLPALDQEDHR